MTTLVRPMRPADVPEAEWVSAEAFHELDRRTFRPSWPQPQRRPAERSAQWVRRTEHWLGTDPQGCWVADRDGRVVGLATSYRRDLTWQLATYAVLPAFQGHGLGRQLLEAALNHSSGCLRAMLTASDDPGALRRYKLAGFDLHPQMFLYGGVDPSRLPETDAVRAGTPGDVPMMDSVDRQVREAAHGPDHAELGHLYPDFRR